MPHSTTIHGFLLFYAGISFLAMFYWLIVFIYSRRRNYLILIAATAAHVINSLNSFGVIFQFRKAEPLFISFLFLAFLVLASELNGFRKHLSSFAFRSYFIFTVSFVIFPVVSPLFLTWQMAVLVSNLLSIMANCVVMSLFLYLWLGKRQATGRFAFFVYLPGMIGYTIAALSLAGVLPSELLIAGPIGMAIFMLLLFYGMVTYVIALRTKREREHLEKEALVLQQNTLLAQKVEERTRELEAEKKRSEELLIKASQRQMAELELQSLRARLNPHFMFNALNAIQELILKEDFENAHTYLSRFAKLLRMLLENTEKPFASLQKEIDFLELYLSLEKLRLPDLQFSISTDPVINKEETLIPNMILQPYIENALWHGLSPKRGDKRLELNIQKQDRTVIYHVKDNGIGLKQSAELKSRFRKEHQSKGTELLAKRFQLLREEYGSGIQTMVSSIFSDGEAAGTAVSIIVPDSLTQQLKNELHDTHYYH